MPSKGKAKSKSKQKNKQTHRNSSDHDTIAGRPIPPDVVFDILARLPVKSLLRFKSVCKRWRTMTTLKPFIAAHLSHSPSSVLLHAHELHFECHGMCSVTISRPKSTITRILHYPGVDDEQFDRYLKVIGSLPNGVVCVSKNLFSDNLILWNPATRSTRWVRPPKLIPDPKIHTGASAGLAYDPSQDDIKIVRLLCHADMETPDLAEVYSHKSGAWTILDPEKIPKFYVNEFECDTVVDGVPFWRGSVNDEVLGERHMLISYRPKDGVFDLESIDWILRNDGTVCVGKIMGCLAVVSWDVIGEDDEEEEDGMELFQMLNVWLKNEDFTWMQLCEVGPLSEIGRVLGFYGARGIVQEIGGNGNLRMFDFEKKDVNEFFLNSHGRVLPGSHKIVAYNESLSRIPAAGSSAVIQLCE